MNYLLLYLVRYINDFISDKEQMTGLFGRYAPVKHEVDGAPRSSLRHNEKLQWKADLAQEEANAREEDEQRELYIKWYGSDSDRLDEIDMVAGRESNYTGKFASNEELSEITDITLGESSTSRFSPTLQPISHQMTIEMSTEEEG